MTQKRRPRWFELPQSGHGNIDCWARDGAIGGGGASPRGPKLTSGAGGRWSAPGAELRRFCVGASRGGGACGIGGMGGGCGMGGGGGVEGASAVAASDAGMLSGGRGASPTGGVGGATRGASL